VAKTFGALSQKTETRPIAARTTRVEKGAAGRKGTNLHAETGQPRRACWPSTAIPCLRDVGMPRRSGFDVQVPVQFRPALNSRQKTDPDRVFVTRIRAAEFLAQGFAE